MARSSVRRQVRTESSIDNGSLQKPRKSTRVAQYLAELDERDTRELDDSGESTTESLAALKARRAELSRLAGYLEQDDRTLVVDGELDARPMGFGRGGKPPFYNIEIAADAETGFIIHHTP